MFDNELDDGKKAALDLDPGTSTAFLPSSVTAHMATYSPSEPADTNTSSFGAMSEQDHEDMSTTHTMNANRALDGKGGRESMSTKEM